ncbi:MAG: metallophosphoesterase family protein [Acetobacteraceae bacterium]|nr:metallophosphoesterase family protein [Acetobacteraceae bacterium]
MIDFATAPATMPPGQRAYAIGDIHGCLERLVAIHELIAEDMVARPTDMATLIHLGDYVDRGPESAQVVDWLLGGPPVPASAIVNLMGNHEHLMLSAIASGEAEAAEIWMSNGGADSLLSWGVPRAAAQGEWAGRIPVPHLLFLRDLATHVQIGPYLFVHAGIRPGVPLDQQSRHDMLWIREPFLSSKQNHGVVVVHGHTPRQEPMVRPNRIGIDTGAVMGGVLTCVVLEDDRLGFLRT